MQATAETVVYNGRHINREFFRVFIYSLDGQKKLVNSYDEFERDISSGIWFESLEMVEEKKAAKPVRKLVRKLKTVSNPETQEIVTEVMIDSEEMEFPDNKPIE